MKVKQCFVSVRVMNYTQCRILMGWCTEKFISVFPTKLNVSSSGSASLLVLKSTGTSCIRDNILAAAFLLASFLEVPLPGGNPEISNVFSC